MDIRPEIVDFDFDFYLTVASPLSLRPRGRNELSRPPSIRLSRSTDPTPAGDKAEKGGLRLTFRNSAKPRQNSKRATGHGAKVLGRLWPRLSGAFRVLPPNLPKRDASMLKAAGSTRQCVLCFRYPTFGVSLPPVGRSPSSWFAQRFNIVKLMPSRGCTASRIA